MSLTVLLLSIIMMIRKKTVYENIMKIKHVCMLWKISLAQIGKAWIVFDAMYFQLPVSRRQYQKPEIYEYENNDLKICYKLMKNMNLRTYQTVYKLQNLRLRHAQ